MSDINIYFAFLETLLSVLLVAIQKLLNKVGDKKSHLVERRV